MNKSLYCLSMWGGAFFTANLSLLELQATSTASPGPQKQHQTLLVVFSCDFYRNKRSFPTVPANCLCKSPPGPGKRAETLISSSTATLRCVKKADCLWSFSFDPSYIAFPLQAAHFFEYGAHGCFTQKFCSQIVIFFFWRGTATATCNLQAGRGRAFPEMTVPTVRAAKSVAGNRPGSHTFSQGEVPMVNRNQ